MKVTKAYEISNAKINFVSLVDKAANKKQFLITKAENGEATFETYGRIVKADKDSHYVTGIVYEPMTEDAHGNYMTEDEITKSAYYFVKTGSKVDVQHSFESIDGASVVESWIAKSDFTINNEDIKKGTWLVTMEIEDPKIWEKIEKGDITGFSMGGVGSYSKDDVPIDNVSKKDDKSEKKSIFKKFAEFMGFDIVEKGTFNDEVKEKMKANNFWSAVSTMEDLLSHWDRYSESNIFLSNEEKIREILLEFSDCITAILTDDTPISKQLSIADDNILKKALKKEDDKLNKKEMEELLEATVEKTLSKVLEQAKSAEPQSEEPKPEEEHVTKEMLDDMINNAVSKALEPVLKSRGLPSNIDDTTDEPIKKQHYLHNIL